MSPGLDDDLDDVIGPRAEDFKWNIQREGREWGDDDFDRIDMLPEKLEVWEGKLLFDENERLLLLGLLLENVGVDRAVRFGDPAVWRAAIAALED